MRTLPAQQTACLAVPTGYGSHARVKVLRGGVWWNLSALGTNGTLDFLQEVEVSESIESPVAQATVRLLRETHGWSLAPLVTTSPLNLVSGSYVPLLAEGRQFTVETCVVPLGMQPQEADWLLTFHGRIDAVDVAEGCTFEGRDLGGGLLQDTYLEAEREYGSDAGVEAERVMAAILSDNLLWEGYTRWQASHTYHDGDRVLPSAGKGTGFLNIGDAVSGTTASSGSTEPTWPTVVSASVGDGGMLWYAEALYLLRTPTSPSWMLGRFLQRGETAMDALSTLAAQLGWEVRWKWSQSAGEYRLTFWSPDRTATTPVLTLAPHQYQQLGQVRTSLEDVRNGVEVVYSDIADVDVAGQPKRKTVVVSDSGSIAALGRRFMRMAEAATSNINTSSEATTLANAALADMKDTPLGLEVEVDYRPDLELGDVVAVEGNGVHFTANQQGAVRALTHSFTAGTATTKLVLLGRPSTSVRRWLSLEQRPATAPASPFTGPSAPSGLTSATTAGGFRLSFSPPTAGAAAAAYELHVSTSSGFTPDDSTRRVVGNLTEVVVTDLLPGTTYYAKVVARDSKGNRGAATSEVTLVPRYVEPRALQPFVHVGSLIPNDSFEANNAPGQPPDGWDLTAGTWGTSAATTSTALSGGTAVLFSGGATNTLASRYVTARPGEVYSVEAWAQRTAVTGTNVASLLMDFMDASFSLIGSSTSVTVNPVVVDGWRRFYAVATAPVGTRYVRVRLNQGSGTPDALYWDSVRLREVRTLSEEQQFPDGVITAFANNFDNVSMPGGTYTRMSWFKGADDLVNMSGRLLRTSGGAPSAGTNILTGLPLPYRPGAEATFIVATDTGPGVVTITAAGAIHYQSGGVGWLSLDGISFRGSPS